MTSNGVTTADARYLCRSNSVLMMHCSSVVGGQAPLNLIAEIIALYAVLYRIELTSLSAKRKEHSSEFFVGTKSFLGLERMESLSRGND